MGGLFGGGKSSTPPPKPRVQRLPVEQDETVMQARRRGRSAALSRQGRDSTILSNLGGGTGTTGGAGGGSQTDMYG